MSRQKTREVHITFTEERTIIHASDKDKVYTPSATAKRFIESNGFINLVMGPYGSGKSSMCVQRIVKSAAKMPYWSQGRRKSRWAVVRNTSGELQSTTLQTWLQWFGDLGDYRKRQKPLLTYDYMFNDGEGVIELELIFIALDRPDDVRKIKSLELTGVYLNELSELPQNVLSHFKGRVNGRFPSRSFCSSPHWSGIIADTNPPDEDHWIFRDFETEISKDYTVFHQPSGLAEDENGLIKDNEGSYVQNPLADNVINLSDDYYPKLASKQTEGFIKVYCCGRYGLVESGKRVYPEFNYDLHSLPKIEAIQGDPLYLGWDFGLCYSDDTEVLTNNGWKFFKDVDENVDLAATRNPITKEFEYTKINFKTEYDWDGELLEWASTEVNFCVTPEHIVPFSYRDTPDKVHFKSAQWLADNYRGHHYVDLCSKWEPEFNESIRYFGMDAHAYAEFMGLYLSEGCIRVIGNSHRIQIYQNKQNPVMQKILDKTGLKWVYSNKHNGVWRVTDNILGSHLKSFGLANEKYIPLEIKNMPVNIIRSFIYSYTAGDGNIRTRKNGSIEHTIFTTSKRMVNDLQELAQKSGWNSSLRIVKPQTSIIIENDIEREITNEGGYSICFKKKAKRAELLNRNFKRIMYKGKIYCLNVPYHTLYIRRNGKPSWNGNTPACVVVQISPRGQVRLLKEYVAEDIGIKTFAKNIVIPRLALDFPYCRVGGSEGDPSGAKGDEIMEELSCIGELNNLGIPTNAATTNDIDVRINSVRYFLNLMIDGHPGFIVSRENCPIIIKGFMSGYHFKRMSISGDDRYQDKPNKNKYSHCFVGETLVATINGERRIDELNVNDKILTPSGYKSITATMSSEINDLIELTFNNDIRIICTLDHPFITKHGIIRADTLQYSDILQCIEDNHFKWVEKQNMKYRYSTELNTIKSVKDITRRIMRYLEQLNICIGMCGNFIMGIFQKDIISITSTTTKVTMTYPTFKSLAYQNMQQFMDMREKEHTKQKDIWILSDHWQANGIAVKKERSSIAELLRLRGKIKKIFINVLSVIRNLKDMHVQIRKGFVRLIASHNKEESQVLITKKENALYASQNLNVTDMQKNRHALRLVKTKRFQMLKRVYDLTVDGEHCFYANGILVSNCHDALQYVLMSFAGKTFTDPDKPKIDYFANNTVMRWQN